LIEEHEAKPFVEKNLVGNLEEESLVGFCEPLMMDNTSGYYRRGSLKDLRKLQPIVSNKLMKKPG
jgi:hypothetical protein